MLLPVSLVCIVCWCCITIKRACSSVTGSLQAGYYCNVCDCILRDSQSYLDHINGKYHNRALGMSMVVEKSTADDVRKKFDELKKIKDDPSPVDSIMDGMCPQDPVFPS